MNLEINIDGSGLKELLVDKIFITFRRQVKMYNRGFEINTNLYEITKLIYDRNYDIHSQKNQNHISFEQEILYPENDFISTATSIYQEFDDKIYCVNDKYIKLDNLILPPVLDTLLSLRCYYNIKATIKFYSITTLNENIDMDVDLYSNYHSGEEIMFINENDLNSYDYFKCKYYTDNKYLIILYNN